MKVLLVYASHYGATEGIAQRIADTLSREGLDVTTQSADTVGRVADSFDAFVIGSAVHAGHWLKPAIDFAERNADVLAQRPVWLFSSGPIGDKHVHEPQPDPKEVVRFRRKLEPQGHVVFAGAFARDVAEARGGFVERAVSRFIPEGDFRDWQAIEGWAYEIAHRFTRLPVPA